MTIHREGHKIILISFVILLAAGLLLNFPPLKYSPFPIRTSLYAFRFIFNVTIILLFIWIVSFFRYPSRRLRNENSERGKEKNIISVADGKVVAIEEVMEKEYFHDKRIQVSVFMSPFNVHANWYPLSGKVKYVSYNPGRYLIAHHPKSSLENEMTTIVIKTTNNKQPKMNNEILVRQIAGVMARRIVCYAENDKEIKQGEELGFIKFGSRIDLLLPLNTAIKVKLNQKVRGNITVIGTLSTWDA
jgi:phosphatidylserine decarboxylase